MDRRLLGWVAVVSTLLTALGLAGADRPLAEWVHASGIEQARAFSLGLGALDVATGVHIWYWLAGSVVLTVGIVACAVRRDLRWPRMLVAAGCVQFACIGTMILGKTWFGRLRPQQVFESGVSIRPFGVLFRIVAAARSRLPGPMAAPGRPRNPVVRCPRTHRLGQAFPVRRRRLCAVGRGVFADTRDLDPALVAAA